MSPTAYGRASVIGLCIRRHHPSSQASPGSIALEKVSPNLAGSVANRDKYESEDKGHRQSERDLRAHRYRRGTPPLMLTTSTSMRGHARQKLVRSCKAAFTRSRSGLARL